MLRIAVVISIFSLFAFSSCKKTGSPKACFYYSAEKMKVGDTLYLLNCSENFQKFIWTYPSTVLDSVNRHTFLIPAGTGTFDVKLVVGNYEFTKTNEFIKTFTVE